MNKEQNQMQKNNYQYITTPIYYVNDKPHIGHSYTNIIADVIARLSKLCNKQVKFLSGTDEHGQKIQQSAIKQNISEQELVDQNSEKFKNLLKILNTSNTDFIRTTDAYHKTTVQNIWKQMIDNDDIYLGKYSGYYSTRDEAYYSKEELTEDGLAPTGAPVVWMEEESYFFKLSKYQDKLLDFYDNNPEFITPSYRMNEVKEFVKSGLKDLSISRTSFNWGIKVPGDERHVIYVWLDALINYISALGYSNDNINQDQFANYWANSIHIVGKDILRFHAIYWPAFLMSLKLPMPKQILAHGWWTNEGQKISKSIGNVIDPLPLIEDYGVDVVRYFLLREVTIGNDGDFSYNRLIIRNNTELSNKLGNLVQRTLSLIYKNCDAKIPQITEDQLNQLYDHDIMIKIFNIKNNLPNILNKILINKLLDDIFDVISDSNIYIDHHAPWKLKKDNPGQMKIILFNIVEIIRNIAILLIPFMPDSMNKILDMINIDINHRDVNYLTKEYVITANQAISKPEIIFPKFDDLT